MGVFETVKNGTESYKVSSLFPCSSKSFLNFRVSSTRFLIYLFLIKQYVSLIKKFLDVLRIEMIGYFVELSHKS